MTNLLKLSLITLGSVVLVTNPITQSLVGIEHAVAETGIFNEDLEHGVGKFVKNVVYKSIDEKCESLGLRDGKSKMTYWAYKAIKDPNDKWATSIENLIKLIVNAFDPADTVESVSCPDMCSRYKSVVNHFCDKIVNLVNANKKFVRPLWEKAEDNTNKCIASLTTTLLVYISIHKYLYDKDLRNMIPGGKRYLTARLEEELSSFDSSGKDKLFNESMMDLKNALSEYSNTILDYIEHNELELFQEQLKHDWNCYLTQFYVITSRCNNNKENGSKKDVIKDEFGCLATIAQQSNHIHDIVFEGIDSYGEQCKRTDTDKKNVESLQEENLKAKARKRIQTLDFEQDFKNLLLLHNSILGRYEGDKKIKEYQRFPVTTWKEYCWQTDRTYLNFLRDYVELKVRYGFTGVTGVSDLYRIMLTSIYPCEIKGKYLIEIIYPEKKDSDLVITLDDAKTIGVSLQPLLELAEKCSQNGVMYDVSKKNFGNRRPERTTFLKKMIQTLPKIYKWSEQVYGTPDPKRGEWLISWSALYICLENKLRLENLGNVSLGNLSKLYLASLKELIKKASDSFKKTEDSKLEDITEHWSHRTHIFILLKILDMLNINEIKTMNGIMDLYEKISLMRSRLGVARGEFSGYDFLGGLRLQNTILACYENGITQLSAQEMKDIALIAKYLYDQESLGVKFKNDEKVEDLKKRLEEIKQTNAKKAGKTVSIFDEMVNKPDDVAALEEKIEDLEYKWWHEVGYTKIESQAYTASYLIPYCIVYVLKAKKICSQNGNVLSNNDRVKKSLGMLFQHVFRGKDLSESEETKKFLNKIVDKPLA